MDGLAPALRRRFLVPGLSRHGAVRRWAARGRPAEDRAIRGGQPEQRAWRARLRPYLLRERRADTARGFLSSWLATYPREGFFHGHLSWHLSLCEIQAGNWDGGAAAVSGRHRARPAQRRSATENVGCERRILWRSELAGHPRDAAAWRAMHEYAGSCTAAAGQRARRSACHSGPGRHGRRCRARRPCQPDGGIGARRALPVRLLPSRTVARLRGVRTWGFCCGDRGARAARGGKRTHWRQPRATRPDRVHFVEGLPRRRPAGGGATSARRAAAWCFRRSRLGVAAVH